MLIGFPVHRPGSADNISLRHTERGRETHARTHAQSFTGRASLSNVQSEKYFLQGTEWKQSSVVSKRLGGFVVQLLLHAQVIKLLLAIASTRHLTVQEKKKNKENSDLFSPFVCSRKGGRRRERGKEKKNFDELIKTLWGNPRL